MAVLVSSIVKPALEPPRIELNDPWVPVMTKQLSPSRKLFFSKVS